MCIAIPGRVIELEDGQAQVDVLGSLRKGGTALYPDVQLGDYVVINAGLIVEILPEDEALANLALLQELMALDEPEDDVGGQDAEDIFGELLGADWLSPEERLNDQP